MGKTKIVLNNKSVLVAGCPEFIGANLVLRLLKDLTAGTIISLDNMNDYYDPDMNRGIPLFSAYVETLLTQLAGAFDVITADVYCLTYPFFLVTMHCWGRQPQNVKYGTTIILKDAS